MNHDYQPRLLRDLRAAAATVTTILIAQAAIGFTLAAARPDLATTDLRFGAVVSALLTTLALVAQSLSRREPAVAAGVVAFLLGVEGVGLAALLGIPELPFPLQITFVVLVYGGLSLLVVAAVCASLSLSRTRPSVGRVVPRRYRNPRRAA